MSRPLRAIKDPLRWILNLNGRVVAEGLYRAVRAFPALACKIHTWRRTNAIAWSWAVSVDVYWLASLARACMTHGGGRFEEELRSALSAIAQACGGNWSIVDSIWRLGGKDRVAAWTRLCAPGAYDSLRDTWSFDEEPEPKPNDVDGGWTPGLERIFKL